MLLLVDWLERAASSNAFYSTTVTCLGGFLRLRRSRKTPCSFSIVLMPTTFLPLSLSHFSVGWMKISSFAVAFSEARASLEQNVQITANLLTEEMAREQAAIVRES